MLRSGSELKTFKVHTGVSRMDNQQAPTVSHMELSSMFYASLDGRRGGVEFGVNGCTHTYG